jgi:NADH dehydrogenase
MGEATGVRLAARTVDSTAGEFRYDYLLLAPGASHAYFGHEAWERDAPGLKTLAQATEIRARILRAFERAESAADDALQRELLTFVVVGGGPTGVELAGAIAEMSRHTLARDFRRIDPRRSRIILAEAGPRILPSFSATLAARAVRDLGSLGVEVRAGTRVTAIGNGALELGGETLRAATILWAAGVAASRLGGTLGVALDRLGRVPVTAELALANDARVFVLGDLAQAGDARFGGALPGNADVAMQEGIYAARTILGDLKGRPRRPFRFWDRGQFATIGRSRALFEHGRFRLSRYPAWWLWLLLHIYRLTGFRNRILVLIQWAWSYWTYGRGARLIVEREWRQHPD